MTMSTEALQRLGLRTHPFLPNLGTNGQPIDPKLFEQALNPHREPRLLGYYFDVYHWSDTAIVGELDPHTGLQNFPAPPDVNDPLLLIVSGTEDTGRSSLINLLRHEIRRHSTSTFEIESLHQSRDQVANVRTIATTFVALWKQNEPNYTQADLKAHLDLYTGFPSEGSDAHYPDLFQRFREATDACDIDPVVVIVRKADHYDVWSSIYHSLAPLAKYVIVETSKPDHAKTCYEQTRKRGGNVALMDARRLDLEGARRYVAARVASERIQAGSPDELWPFTESALSALYEPGTKPQEGGVRWPIGSLRGMLRATFDSHLEHMSGLPKPLAGLTDEQCAITRDRASKASSKWQSSKGKKK